MNHMKKIALLGMLTTCVSGAFAASEPTPKNQINFQSDISREIPNDEMHAVLFIELSHKQPASLAQTINQQLNQALSIAKKYPQVKVTTGAQSTYPVYDNDNQKLKEWRSRAEIQLESQNFSAASQLISELQQNFQTQSINFNVSDEARKKVENELLVEVTKNFQQRAQLLTQAWNKTGYQLVNFNVNTSNYQPQPVMMRASVAKFAVESADAQQVSAGDSKVTVTANGIIELK